MRYIIYTHIYIHTYHTCNAMVKTGILFTHSARSKCFACNIPPIHVRTRCSHRRTVATKINNSLAWQTESYCIASTVACEINNRTIWKQCPLHFVTIGVPLLGSSAEIFQTLVQSTRNMSGLTIVIIIKVPTVKEYEDHLNSIEVQNGNDI